MKSSTLKQTLLLFCFVFISTSFIYGQNANTQKANETLLKALNYLKSMSSMEVNFSIEVQDADNKKLASQSGVAKLKGKKYQLSLGDQKIYSDGKLMWIYNEIFNEVQIENYKQKLGTNLLDVENILGGNLDTKQFKSKFNGTETVDNVDCELLELTPTDKKNTFFKVLLWIDTKTSSIKRAKIFDKTGTRYIYKTKKLMENPTFASNFGKFDVANYPDIEVIDLR